MAKAELKTKANDGKVKDLLNSVAERKNGLIPFACWKFSAR
jgi:hypothetical protein